MAADRSSPWVAALCGALFSAGLMLSGMSNPANVIAFLDVAGTWNPALAFVMGGAIAVAAPAYALARRRRATLSGVAIELPETHTITAPLVGGSLLFGVCWGLAGLCPGPAVVLAGIGAVQGALYALAFVAAMLGGLWLAGRFGPWA